MSCTYKAHDLRLLLTSSWRKDSFVLRRQYVLNELFPIAHNQLKRIIRSYRANKEVRLGRGSGRVSSRFWFVSAISQSDNVLKILYFKPILSKSQPTRCSCWTSFRKISWFQEEIWSHQEVLWRKCWSQKWRFWFWISPTTNEITTSRRMVYWES